MPFLEDGKWDFLHNRKMGMGFQFEQHRLGLWDLSCDLKKTISLEMGLEPPPPPFHDPLQGLHGHSTIHSDRLVFYVTFFSDC